MEDLVEALFSLAALFVGLVIIFAQVRLFTYLPKIHSTLEQILEQIEHHERIPTKAGDGVDHRQLTLP